MELSSPLVIQRVKLDSLNLDPANARAHDERNLGAIKASLVRFGQAEPLVVQAGTRRVVGGNGRLVAMRALGWSAADVVELELTDLEAASLGIALNRTGELAAWDEESLAKILEVLRAEEALDGTGFSDEEVALLLSSSEADEAIVDPGAGELPANPTTRRGDLWLLGNHRLLCGDSTSPEDLKRLMAGERAHLLCTDPPYLVDYQDTKERQRDTSWDGYQGPDEALAFFEAWLKACLPHCVEEVVVYQWHASRRQALVEQAWDACGLLLHQTLIWSKPRGVFGRSHFAWSHEPCFYGWSQGSMPPKERRPPPGERTVWEIDQAADTVHPTQKALEVFERPIGFHTLEGEVCLEPFSGSGTQLVAAERLRRRCFAMELTPGYADVALVRWQKASGQEAKLEGSGQTFAEVLEERSHE